MVAWWVARLVVGPRALYLEMARLMVRGLTRSRRPGIGLASRRRPMLPARSMVGLAVTPAAWTSWSGAACRAGGKLARSGAVPGGVGGASGMAEGRIW